MAQHARLLTTAGAAAHTGMSVSFLNQARRSGRGPVFLKMGRRVLYDPTDLDVWMTQARRRRTDEVGHG